MQVAYHDVGVMPRWLGTGIEGGKGGREVVAEDVEDQACLWIRWIGGEVVEDSGGP